MDTLNQKKDELIEIGKALYKKGLLVGTDSNFSIRLNHHEILITASGLCKGKLTQDRFTLVDLQGNILHRPNPARDIRMHFAVYQKRRDVHAVVHAHPPIATGLSMTTRIQYELERCALPEVLFNLHGIAVTEYCTPISCEVPEKLIKAMEKIHWQTPCSLRIMAC